jgi:hypothetical protein
VTCVAQLQFRRSPRVWHLADVDADLRRVVPLPLLDEVAGPPGRITGSSSGELSTGKSGTTSLLGGLRRETAR